MSPCKALFLNPKWIFLSSLTTRYVDRPTIYSWSARAPNSAARAPTVACSVRAPTSHAVPRAIGTTRPIPPNQRSCLGCIRWKDMSNPKRLRWNIVLKETYESRSAITNDRKQCAIGTTRPIPPNLRSCQVVFYTYVSTPCPRATLTRTTCQAPFQVKHFFIYLLIHLHDYMYINTLFCGFAPWKILTFLYVYYQLISHVSCKSYSLKKAMTLKYGVT